MQIETNTAEESQVEAQQPESEAQQGQDGIVQEGQESEAPQNGEAEQSSGEESETELTFGDEAAPASEEGSTLPWVTELRRKNRELEKTARQQAEELAKLRSPQQVAKSLRAKPTLADHDYDEQAYEADLEAWTTEKRDIEEESRAEQLKQQEVVKNWNAKVAAYNDAGNQIANGKFEEASGIVTSVLNQVQQGVILQGFDDPARTARFVYALSRFPQKAQQLASIEDPVKFAFAAAHLESQLKETPRNKIPAPERRISGNAPASVKGKDTKLQALEDEADRTGDRSKVIAYRKQMRQA